MKENKKCISSVILPELLFVIHQIKYRKRKSIPTVTTYITSGSSFLRLVVRYFISVTKIYSIFPLTYQIKIKKISKFRVLSTSVTSFYIRHFTYLRQIHQDTWNTAAWRQ